MLDPNDLMSASDIARLMKVVPSTVSNWQKRKVGFPKPVAIVNNGRTPLFSRKTIIQWFTKGFIP